MQLPVFQTMGEILDYCWARRHVLAVHGAAPVGVISLINLGLWLMGIDIPFVSLSNVAMSFVGAIIVLPFTVTWYRMIILGDGDLAKRPVFSYSAREGRLLVWQIIIIIGMALFAGAGLAVLNLAGQIFSGPVGQFLQSVLLLAFAVSLIASLCRLSLVLAMAATDRPVDVAEAWGRTAGLGTRMAAIFLLSVLIGAALVIPLLIIVVFVSSIFGAVSESLGEDTAVLLAIVPSAIGSLMTLVLPTTLFGFVYNRIAEQMGSGGVHTSHALAHTTHTPTPETAPEEEPAKDVDDVIANLIAFMDGKPRETAEDTRELVDGFFSQFPMPGEALLEDFEAGGVPCRWVVMPESDVDKVVLLLHGGGFSAGSLDSHQRLAADLSAVCETRVLMVDYRLAPEDPYPAGLDDCVTVYRWLLDNGFKPGHIAIAGDSAGGGLTISTALRLKDESVDQPACLVAMSPWVNLACDGETMETKAKEDPIGSQETLLRAAQDYLKDDDVRDPLVSPIYGDLRGLPPLLIQVGSREVLLDDSRKLAVRARADDVQVTLEEWPGMIHDWQMMADWLTDGRRALAGIGTFVRHRLG